MMYRERSYRKVDGYKDIKGVVESLVNESFSLAEERLNA